MYLAKEVSSWQEKTKLERRSDFENVELIDEDLEKVQENIKEIEMKIDQDRTWQRSAVDSVECLDGKMVEMLDVQKDHTRQLNQIKNSDVNNRTEFYRLKKKYLMKLIYKEIVWKKTYKKY